MAMTSGTIPKLVKGDQLHGLPTLSQSAFHQHRHRTTPIAHLLSFLSGMIDATFMHTMSRIGHAIITRLVFGS